MNELDKPRTPIPETRKDISAFGDRAMTGRNNGGADARRGGGGNQLEIKLTDKPSSLSLCISVRNASQSVPLLAAVSDRDEHTKTHLPLTAFLSAPSPSPGVSDSLGAIMSLALDGRWEVVGLGRMRREPPSHGSGPCCNAVLSRGWPDSGLGPLSHRFFLMARDQAVR